MARPKKWASEADRKRSARQSGRNPDADALKTDAPVNPDTSIRTPADQWRLDAQEYMRTGKLPKVPAPSPGFVRFKDCPDVPHDPKAPPWLGAGRGVVREYKGKRYVLVARHRGVLDVDALEHGVVTADDHAARLNQRCQHKRTGWACHAC